MKLMSSVKKYKDKLVVINCPSSFNFPTVWSTLIHIEDVRLLENDRATKA